MKKLFLLAVAALILVSANAQLKRPTKPAASAPTLVSGKPLAQMQEMQMRDPGSALSQAPQRASRGAEVYYRRPAGAFPGWCVMERSTNDFVGMYMMSILHIKPYKPYTFNGFASGTIGEPRYDWVVPYYDVLTHESVSLNVNRCKDLTIDYPSVFLDVPMLSVTDDEKTYNYMMATPLEGETSAILPWPDWSIDEEHEVLKSSVDFAMHTSDESSYPFIYYAGMTPYGNNDYGWWFGKNRGNSKGVHADGIAQAFEKPEHPYLLKQVVLMVSQLKVTSNTEMTCKVYRLNDLLDYQDTTSVVLPEDLGEPIATGVTCVTPSNDETGIKLITFPLYAPDEDFPVILKDCEPTIDEAILVVFEGYNAPEMSSLENFTAMIGADFHYTDGFGERAYIKVGKDDADGNFDGHYQWQGLNNFFSTGEMKTGLSIFLVTEQPFLLSNTWTDDYEYTFPAAGGVMEDSYTDAYGDTVTLRSIELASWTPASDSWSWSITCDGGDLPSWLEINLDDVREYIVNAEVYAHPLPEGTDYREAVVRFAIPGDYIDYKFKQVRQGGEQPDTTVQEKTPMPEITVDVTDKYVIIGATGNGNVMLYFDGFNSPDNPVHYVRTGVDRSVVVTATAQEDGKLISDTARRVVDIPAVEVPVEGYWLQMYDATVNAGDTIIIPVDMWNENDVVAYQTDIELPEGFELVKEDGKYAISLSDRASADHTVMANELSDGKIRVLCYSTDNIAFTGDRGELFYLPVKVSKDANDGTVRLRNTRFTLSDLTEYNTPSVAVAAITVNHILPGDVNDSGDVTVTDIVTTAQYILEMNPSPFIFEAADMNVDGIITVTDISLIANIILNPTMNMPQRAPVMNGVDGGMTGKAISLAKGETQTVSIDLDNCMDYTGFQLDVKLPAGLTASNFALTDRDGSHTLAVNELSNGTIRVLCYSPALRTINGNSGTVLTFDVTATDYIDGLIDVNGIELVTPACQTFILDGFAISVNSPSAVSDLYEGKAVLIYAEGRDVIVESPVQQLVGISDLAGRMRHVNVVAGRNVISTGGNGVYIVIADGQATKLMLK